MRFIPPSDFADAMATGLARDTVPEMIWRSSDIRRRLSGSRIRAVALSAAEMQQVLNLNVVRSYAGTSAHRLPDGLQTPILLLPEDAARDPASLRTAEECAGVAEFVMAMRRLRGMP